MSNLLRRVRNASIIPMMMMSASTPILAQSAAYVEGLGLRLKQFYEQGKINEAIPVAEELVAAYERGNGVDHPVTLHGRQNLASLYLEKGRYDDAERQFQLTLKGRQRVLGKDHRDTLETVNGLGELYRRQGRYAKAEEFLGHAHRELKRVLGPNDSTTLATENNLALVYQAVGRYDQAEPLFKDVLQNRQKLHGNDHAYTLLAMHNLATLNILQGRYAEAELLERPAFEGRERLLGKEHPHTISSLNGLAELYRLQGRYGDAEPLYRRVLDTNVARLGKAHPNTISSVNNLALLYFYQKRYSDAEPLFLFAVKAFEQSLGKDHPETLNGFGNLALLYSVQKRFSEAEPLLKSVLESRERVIGKEHPSTLLSTINFAQLLQEQGRYGEAEALFKRVSETGGRVLGIDHPHTLLAVSRLAHLYFDQSDWAKAASYWRENAVTSAGRMRFAAQALGRAITSTDNKQAVTLDTESQFLIKAVYRQTPKREETPPKEFGEMFETAQLAVNTEAARSLAAMAARGAKGDAKLEGLIRERQDLAAEWKQRDSIRDLFLSQPAANRGTAIELDNASRLKAIDARIAAVDTTLVESFPNYSALANPKPLAVNELQEMLEPDEALVLFLATPELGPTPGETFIWLVTKTSMRWVRSGLGREQIAKEVERLRCGLDYTSWIEPSKCGLLTGGGTYNVNDYGKGTPPPFDRGHAHELYKSLFGDLEDLIKGKHLLIIPSGALTQLPFHALVTKQPTGDQKATAWLARDHAVTILPGVSSLKALRRVAGPSRADKPYIGFGNPLLDGPDQRYAPLAKEARARQQCPKSKWDRVAAIFGVRGVAAMGTASVSTYLSQIRAQPPLPETADELCAVAQNMDVDASELRLGAAATEREVKALSNSGKLAQYRVIHFATHGAMAGELNTYSEPGLILTPPEQATRDDNGYLTASDIAGLKLDADWVILSACNTAAGNAASAEALSGLASAFFYAQARAVLVSHWAVDSKVTVKLITVTMREFARDKTVGRAEALRRAMLALIDKGEAHEAYPAYWAPFVVVGEGVR